MHGVVLGQLCKLASGTKGGDKRVGGNCFQVAVLSQHGSSTWLTALVLCWQY